MSCEATPKPVTGNGVIVVNPLVAPIAPHEEVDFVRSFSKADSDEPSKLSTGEIGPTALPPIRLIPFAKFKTLNAFPRYPENADITVTLDSIDRPNSFVVFISHCWKRGYAAAPGYDGRPHPDTATHQKFELCEKAIAELCKLHASRLQYCYVWLDFGCINQDSDPCQELKQLDKIVQMSDCMLTPIVDDKHSQWKLKYKSSNGLISDYLAEDWQGSPFAYQSRSWCRMEMLYAANVPLADTFKEPARLNKFDSGLRRILGAGRRAHFLFGTKEMLAMQPPLVLEPLQNSYLMDFDPATGSITQETDRPKIRELMKELEAYIKRVEPRYEGTYNKKNEFHGQGTMHYANGSIYVGEWRNNWRWGEGEFTFANGDKYSGHWERGKRCGFGKMEYVSGDTYEGAWKNDRMHGKGTYNYCGGEAYHSTWKNDKKHGSYLNDSMYVNDVLYLDVLGRDASWDEDASCCDSVFLCCNICCCCLPSICSQYITAGCFFCLTCGSTISDFDDGNDYLLGFFCFRNCLVPWLSCFDCKCCSHRVCTVVSCCTDCDIIFPCCFSLQYNDRPKPLQENDTLFSSYILN